MIVWGGCDGCVDLESLDNRGLELPIQTLEPLTKKYARHLSRADLWALAGLTAATVAQPTDATQVPLEMKWVGRVSCPNATGGPKDRILPSSHWNTTQVLNYFQTVFNFTTVDTVAIMGAHALGRAVRNHSGYQGEGGWVRPNASLDHEYYRILLDDSGGGGGGGGGGQVNPLWTLELQNNTGTPFVDQYLWRRPPLSSLPPPNLPGPFMLNADMALVVDFASHIDPVIGSVNCTLPNATTIIPGQATCPDAPTLKQVIRYAGNNLLWLHHFREALIKMTMNGYVGMNCPAAVCPLVPRDNKRLLRRRWRQSVVAGLWWSG